MPNTLTKYFFFSNSETNEPTVISSIEKSDPISKEEVLEKTWSDELQMGILSHLSLHDLNQTQQITKHVREIGLEALITQSPHQKNVRNYFVNLLRYRLGYRDPHKLLDGFSLERFNLLLDILEKSDNRVSSKALIVAARIQLAHLNQEKDKLNGWFDELKAYSLTLEKSADVFIALQGALSQDSLKKLYQNLHQYTNYKFSGFNRIWERFFSHIPQQYLLPIPVAAPESTFDLHITLVITKSFSQNDVYILVEIASLIAFNNYQDGNDEVLDHHEMVHFTAEILKKILSSKKSLLDVLPKDKPVEFDLNPVFVDAIKLISHYLDSQQIEELYSTIQSCGRKSPSNFYALATLLPKLPNKQNELYQSLLRETQVWWQPATDHHQSDIYKYSDVSLGDILAYLTPEQFCEIHMNELNYLCTVLRPYQYHPITPRDKTLEEIYQHMLSSLLRLPSAFALQLMYALLARLDKYTHIDSYVRLALIAISANIIQSNRLSVKEIQDLITLLISENIQDTKDLMCAERTIVKKELAFIWIAQLPANEAFDFLDKIDSKVTEINNIFPLLNLLYLAHAYESLCLLSTIPNIIRQSAKTLVDYSSKANNVIEKGCAFLLTHPGFLYSSPMKLLGLLQIFLPLADINSVKIFINTILNDMTSIENDYMNGQAFPISKTLSDYMRHCQAQSIFPLLLDKCKNIDPKPHAQNMMMAIAKHLSNEQIDSLIEYLTKQDVDIQLSELHFLVDSVGRCDTPRLRSFLEKLINPTAPNFDMKNRLFIMQYIIAIAPCDKVSFTVDESLWLCRSLLLIARQSNDKVVLDPAGVSTLLKKITPHIINHATLDKSAIEFLSAGTHSSAKAVEILAYITVHLPASEWHPILYRFDSSTQYVLAINYYVKMLAKWSQELNLPIEYQSLAYLIEQRCDNDARTANISWLIAEAFAPLFAGSMSISLELEDLISKNKLPLSFTGRVWNQLSPQTHDAVTKHFTQGTTSHAINLLPLISNCQSVVEENAEVKEEQAEVNSAEQSTFRFN